MKCNDFQPLQGAYLDSELDAKTSLEIQQHLATCPDCACAFAADANLEARIVGSLKRGQRTAPLWEQIEQRVAASAAPVSDPIGRSGASAERHNLTPRNAIGRRSTESPLRDSETVLARVGCWWRELLWPSPRAWAGLAAVWVVVLSATLATREPATLAEVRRSSPPSRQTRELLQEQRQMLAELNSLTDPLETEQTSGAVLQPRSQRREPLSNT